MNAFARNNTLILILGLLIFSCQKPKKPTDQIVNSSAQNSSSSDGSDTTGSSGDEELDKIPKEENACSDSNDPGPAPLLRLTAEQYKNSIKEIFGETQGLDKILPTPNRKEIGSALGSPSLLEISQYAEAASFVADSVVTKLQDFAPCENNADLEAQRSCVSRFLDEYGVLIYRSELTSTDKDNLDAIFQEGAKTSYDQGMHLVIQALLESPRFIYRIEKGDKKQNDKEYASISDYELASRLSFVLWNQTPDRDLLDSVKSGAFATDAGYQKQVDRLLQDERADLAFVNFARSWLGLQSDFDKDTDIFPAWNEDVLRAMNTQADEYLKTILLESKHNMDSFFQHSHQEYAPNALKAWYDESNESSGVLSLPLLLSNHSKAYETFPIARGVFMLEKILCIHLPDPPGDVGELPAFADFKNNRERFAAHSSNPECKSCHQFIDPMGFAFENYDAIGQFRLKEKGQNIDASGELTGIDVGGNFTNLHDLAKKLATSQNVKQCITRHWFRYAMQRREVSADKCSLSKMMSAFSASNFKFTELRTSILNTPAFTHRRVLETGKASEIDTKNEDQEKEQEQEQETPDNTGETPDSLVQNGSFENGTEPWTLRGQGIIKLPSDDNSVFSPQTNDASMRQTITIEPNTEYEVSVMINVLPGTSGRAVFDTNDRFDDTAQFVQSTGTNGWEKFTGTFNSGAFNEVVLRVFVEDEFNGTVYFDDIELKKK